MTDGLVRDASQSSPNFLEAALRGLVLRIPMNQQKIAGIHLDGVRDPFVEGCRSDLREDQIELEWRLRSKPSSGPSNRR